MVFLWVLVSSIWGLLFAILFEQQYLVWSTQELLKAAHRWRLCWFLVLEFTYQISNLPWICPSSWRTATFLAWVVPLLLYKIGGVAALLFCITCFCQPSYSSSFYSSSHCIDSLLFPQNCRPSNSQCYFLRTFLCAPLDLWAFLVVIGWGLHSWVESNPVHCWFDQSSMSQIRKWYLISAVYHYQQEAILNYSFLVQLVTTWKQVLLATAATLPFYAFTLSSFIKLYVWEPLALIFLTLHRP